MAAMVLSTHNSAGKFALLLILIDRLITSFPACLMPLFGL
jgi:hypothetical protein